LVEGRPLVIGGVSIPHTHGLLGHSDADVLTHAIIDALLRAAALGTSRALPGYRRALPRRRFDRAAAAAVALLAQRECVVEHVDATVVLEQPKLLPHRAAMHARLVEALGVADLQLNLKATRGEGMGFVGRLEARRRSRSRRSRGRTPRCPPSNF